MDVFESSHDDCLMEMLEGMSKLVLNYYLYLELERPDTFSVEWTSSKFFLLNTFCKFTSVQVDPTN